MFEVRDAIIGHVTALGAINPLADNGADDAAIYTAWAAMLEASYLVEHDLDGYVATLSDWLALAALGDSAEMHPLVLREIGLIEIEPVAGMITASLLTGFYAALLLDVDYPSRDDAVRARSVLASIVDQITEPIGDILGHVAMADFLDLTGSVSLALSEIAASEVPLVRVETGISMPSTLVAWKLYADPERSGELVFRNETGTPVYLPTEIEALAE